MGLCLGCTFCRKILLVIKKSSVKLMNEKHFGAFLVVPLVATSTSMSAFSFGVIELLERINVLQLSCVQVRYSPI